MNKKPSREAIEAAQLEIAANYLRAAKYAEVELGHFVQNAIDDAINDYIESAARG